MSVFIKRGKIRRVFIWLEIGWYIAFVTCLIALGVAISLKTVDIVDGEETTTITTMALTVDAALRQAKIDYAPCDRISPGPEQPLKNGMVIEVVRAENVTISADGKQWTVKAVQPEAYRLLKAEGVQLGELDQIDFGRYEDGSKYVKVTRITEEFIEERIEVPHDTFQQPSNQLLAGQRRVIQPGKNGVLVNKIKVVKADGVEVSRQVVSSRVLAEPKTSVIAYGIAKAQAPAARNIQGKVKKVMTMEATAYTHTGNPTATGIYPYKGVVAVDPKVIPLGSKLYVEGYGYCEAQDTGGAIKGDRIDVFLDTKEQCFEWGRKIVQVYLLE